MATSGSINYNLTRNDIITEALELAGVVDIGATIEARYITTCARTLEILIKGWQSEGVYFWKSRDFVVFPQYQTASFDLGSTGDHACLYSDLIKTEIATAADSSDSTIDVDDDTGIADGDAIGIELDGGTIQWTTVNGTPSSDTITLTTALTDDVAVDNHVYTYTTILNRPLWINEHGRLYRNDNSESPFTLTSRNEYNDISIKSTDGVPNQGWYDPQLTNGKLYIWPRNSDVKDYLILTGKFTIEDFDAATNDAEFPQEWYLALTWQLAVHIAPKFLKRSLDANFINRADLYLNAVATFDKDDSSIFIEIED